MEGSRHFVTKAGHIPQPSLPLSLSFTPSLHGKIKQVVQACWKSCVEWRWPVPQPVWCVCVLQNEAPALSEREPLSLPYQFWERTSATPSPAAHMVCAWQPEETPPLQIHSHVHTHTHSDTHTYMKHMLYLHTYKWFPHSHPTYKSKHTSACTHTHTQRHHLFSLYFILKHKRRRQR